VVDELIATNVNETKGFCHHCISRNTITLSYFATKLDLHRRSHFDIVARLTCFTECHWTSTAMLITHTFLDGMSPGLTMSIDRLRSPSRAAAATIHVAKGSHHLLGSQKMPLCHTILFELIIQILNSITSAYVLELCRIE
jgi:hypothetical protein